MHDVDRGKLKIFSERFLTYYGSNKLEIVSLKDNAIRDSIKKSHLLVKATPFGRKKGEVTEGVGGLPHLSALEEARAVGRSAVRMVERLSKGDRILKA